MPSLPCTAQWPQHSPQAREECEMARRASLRSAAGCSQGAAIGGSRVKHVILRDVFNKPALSGWRGWRRPRSWTPARLRSPPGGAGPRWGTICKGSRTRRSSRPQSLSSLSWGSRSSSTSRMVSASCWERGNKYQIYFEGNSMYYLHCIIYIVFLYVVFYSMYSTHCILYIKELYVVHWCHINDIQCVHY